MVAKNNASNSDNFYVKTHQKQHITLLIYGFHKTFTTFYLFDSTQTLFIYYDYTYICIYD